MRSTSVEVRLLGPVEIVGDAGPVPLAARKHRQLLTALLVSPGTTQSTDSLVDALWDVRPPRSAGKLLQVYVSQLRKLLPAPIVISTRDCGYAIEFDQQLLDVVRFEALLADARAAARTANPALAASLFRRALALWRGPAYGEFAGADFARAEADRLEELRRVVLEERIDAELRLGAHRELLPELRSFAAAHPLRERIQAQVMLALYRCGQQSEALEFYRAVRARLVDELGVEPGSELRELQTQILQQDARLALGALTEESAVDLPTPPNVLIGRQRELAELRELLLGDDVRLVVLTGAGGSGKTRLALEAARANAGAFANGAAVVLLGGVRDPDLVVASVSSALGLPQSDEGGVESLASALRSREMLLVLDNFEQLRAAGPVLARVLELAPRLTLLVTSRVVLHLSGEHVFPVDPLAIDSATALFVERAREADVRFDPAAAEDDTVRQLCERLDRLPLAIELAASRSRTLTVAELLHRLDARLKILTGGPKDLPARQQTLRATLEWSFDQLEEIARRDIVALSVFRGSWSLDAAEAVCATSVERMAVLLDNSLLVRTRTSYGSRYSMLETVREFASERFEASGSASGEGQAEELRRRHAEHFLALAETFGLSVDELGSGVPQRHDLARLEQDNMRAALDWAQTADPELGLRVMLALEQFWIASSPRESMHRMEALVAGAGDLPIELRARTLRDLGGASEVSGHWQRAVGYYRQSLQIYQQLGHETGILRLQHRLALLDVFQGNFLSARVLVENALARAKARGFHYEASDLLRVLAQVELHDGNVEAAYALELESLDLSRRLGAWPWGETSKLRALAELCTLLGHFDAAERHGREALELSHQIGDRIKTVFAIAALALVALARGDAGRAGRLWGAIEAEEQRSFLGWWTRGRERYGSLLQAAGAAEFDRGRRIGHAYSFAEAVAQALGSDGNSAAE